MWSNHTFVQKSKTLNVKIFKTSFIYTKHWISFIDLWGVLVNCLTEGNFGGQTRLPPYWRPAGVRKLWRISSINQNHREWTQMEPNVQLQDPRNQHLRVISVSACWTSVLEDTVKPSLTAQDINPIAYAPDPILHPAPDSYSVWFSWLGQSACNQQTNLAYEVSSPT